MRGDQFDIVGANSRRSQADAEKGGYYVVCQRPPAGFHEKVRRVALDNGLLLVRKKKLRAGINWAANADGAKRHLTRRGFYIPVILATAGIHPRKARA